MDHKQQPGPGTFSSAIRAAKIKEATAVADIAKSLKQAIEEDYTRMTHGDFHRLIWPIISSTEPDVDLTIVTKVAKNPQAPIIVTDTAGNEIYRMPPLWNTRNLEHRSLSRKDSISFRATEAAMRANSGTVPPSSADAYVVSQIQHLVGTVEISLEDKENWDKLWKYNAGDGVGTELNAKAVPIAKETGVELDGEYSDL